MIPEDLRQAEHDFRLRVARRDYGDLTYQMSDLLERTKEHLAHLPTNEPARRELISWAIALTDWGHKMICSQRQRWADEKQPLETIGLYLQGQASPPARFCIDL